MIDTIPLIQNRRQALSDEIARLKSQIAAVEAELAELDTAARVIARLSGKELPDTARFEASVETAKPANIPTIPEMIIKALEAARNTGAPGLKPSGMSSYIAETWWRDVPGTAVSSAAWRMWKRGNLRKEGTLYMLPSEKAADSQSGPDQSAALSQPEAHDREAGPGGGT